MKLTKSTPANHAEYLLDIGISAICDALELPKTINPYYKRQTNNKSQDTPTAQTMSVAQHMNTPLQTPTDPTTQRISTASRLNLLRETLLDGILGTDNNLAPELIHWIQHTLKPKYPKQYAALIGKLIPKTNEHIHENQNVPSVLVLGDQIVNTTIEADPTTKRAEPNKTINVQSKPSNNVEMDEDNSGTIYIEELIPTTRQLNFSLLFSDQSFSAEKEALYCHANAIN